MTKKEAIEFLNENFQFDVELTATENIRNYEKAVLRLLILIFEKK